ncbi:MAG: hypothetical protein NTW21_33970, partial [Verrucomicrobia bacterium]|nr:hypothetical protein [Verrucomicrobiota bacterium]
MASRSGVASVTPAAEEARVKQTGGSVSQSSRNDAFDAAGADGVAELPELLGDDLGADRRIGEAEADGQPDDLVGAAVV